MSRAVMLAKRHDGAMAYRLSERDVRRTRTIRAESSPTRVGGIREFKRHQARDRVASDGGFSGPCDGRIDKGFVAGRCTEHG